MGKEVTSAFILHRLCSGGLSLILALFSCHTPHTPQAFPTLFLSLLSFSLPSPAAIPLPLCFLPLSPPVHLNWSSASDPVQPSAAAQLHPLHATALPIHWPEHPPIPCGTRLEFIQGGGGAWAGQKPEEEGGRRVSAVAREWNSPPKGLPLLQEGLL